MKTFTDDDGNKYKASGIAAGDFIVIKPVAKLVEKQEYNIGIQVADKGTAALWFDFLELTKLQAEALASAIQALVEYCHVPVRLNEDHLLRMSRDAGKAMQQDNE